MKLDIRPIKTDRDYDWALTEIEKYFDREPKQGTAAAARFDVLAALIEGYEAQHWPIDAPDAVSAIQFRMKQRGWTQNDLAKLLGSKSRASEILARKRQLTLAQAYKLNRDWQIPAEALLRQHQDQ